MRFEIRLTGREPDVFSERLEPKSPREGQNYHSYWFEGHVGEDGALEVFEMVQLHYWASGPKHYILREPERRRSVAHYTAGSWVNFATIDKL